MASHDKKHGIIASDDHNVGSTAAANEVNVIGTNSVPAIVEVAVEAPGAASTTSKIVRRATDGHIAVPTSGQADNEVLSKQQVEDLITSGIWKSAIHSAVADHTAATVGDGGSGGPSLTTGDMVINTTDEKIYTVVSGTGNGSAVTWDSGVLPTTAEVRLAELDNHTWIFDTDAGAWVDSGASTHSQQHAMSSTSDHSAGNWKLFYSNGSGQVAELALGSAGTPLLGQGTTAAPVFGSLKMASAVINAAGATPVDTDVSSVATDSFGIIKGTGGRIWQFFKNSSDVYYTEMTAI